eukprot:15364980-Ditylum_brightwellii.AAC.1
MDHVVGAPGHDKDVVDGSNAVEKKYLKTYMLRHSIPDEDTNVKTMSCHSATPMGSACFAIKCKHLLQHHANHVSNILASKSILQRTEIQFMEVEQLYLIIIIDLIPGLNIENVLQEEFHPCYAPVNKTHGSGAAI